jgi:hypothetical protein
LYCIQIKQAWIRFKGLYGWNNTEVTVLCQVCGEKGHRKMDCQKLPEERRNELKVSKLYF